MAKTNLSQSDLDKSQQSEGPSPQAPVSADGVTDGGVEEEVAGLEDFSDIAVELSSAPTLYSTPPDHPRAGKVIFFPPKPRTPAGAEGSASAGQEGGTSPESWSSLAPVLPPPTPLRKPVFGGAAAAPPELAPVAPEAVGAAPAPAAPRSGSTVAPHLPGVPARPKSSRPANAVRSAALRPAAKTEEPTGEILLPKRRSVVGRTLAAVVCFGVIVGGGAWLIRTRGADAYRAALLKLGKGAKPPEASVVKGSTQGAEQAIAADPDLAPPDFEAAFPARRAVPVTPLPPRTSAAPPAPPPKAQTPATPHAAAPAPAPVHPAPAAPPPAPAQVATANPIPAAPSKPVNTEADFAKLLSQGQESAKAGKHTNAVSTFRKALALNPSSVDAKAGLGAALVHSSRTNEGYLEAVKLLREAVTEEPSLANAWFALGTGNQFIGRGKDAAEAYRHFLEIEPEGSTADEVRSILKDLGG